MKLQAQIDHAKAKVDPARFLDVDCETFCRDPRRTVYDIASLAPGVAVHEQKLERELLPFQPSDQSRLSDEDIERMEEFFRVESSGTIAGRRIGHTTDD